MIIILISSGINFSYAEQVTFRIDAVIDHIYDPNNALANRLKLGDSLSSVYTFETTVPDSASSPVYGFYNQENSAGNGFSLNIKNLSPSPITSRNVAFHSINTWNNQGDFFYAESKMRSAVGNNLTITFIGLEVFDNTGHALSNDKLTSTPPNIKYARDKNILISGRAEGASEDFEIRAAIKSITNAKDRNTVASRDF